MTEPTVGQRYVVMKEAKGQRFRQTFMSNREKQSGTMTVDIGTILEFIGSVNDRNVERLRFTSDAFAGEEVRIGVEEARRKLLLVDAPPIIAAQDLVSTRPAAVRPQEVTAAQPPSGIGVAEELQRFASLRDSGVLTEEEFQAQKARLLGAGTTQHQGPHVTASADGLFDLYLIRTGSRLSSVIGVLKGLSDAGLSTAKLTAQSAPQRILNGIPKAEAERAGHQLTAAGATIHIQPKGTPLSGSFKSPPPPPPPRPPRKPWYLQPTTYVKLFLAWVLLLGVATGINWLREEPDLSSQPQGQPTQNARPGPTPNPTPAPTTPSSRSCRDVRIFVTGTANTVSVTFGRGTEISQSTNQSVPLRNSAGLLGLGLGCLSPGTFVSILAQNEGDRGVVECRIEADGTAISQARSTGAYVIASCSETVPRR
jgi:ribosomal protein L7/L12